MLARSSWGVGLALGAVAAYAGLSHWLMLNVADRPWAIVVLLGPMVLTALVWALRHHLGVALAIAVAALLALGIAFARSGWGGASRGADAVNQLYVAQHAGIHLMLFVGFAATLRGRGLSLISVMAQRLHPLPLTPAMVRYTRGVTVLWAAYFAFMAVTSVAVYLKLSWASWSLLANLLTPLAVIALFVAEYVYRYWRHPEFERVRMMDAVHAYRDRSRDAP